MSQELIELVNSWTKNNETMAEKWLDILKERDIEDLDTLIGLHPKNLSALLESIKFRPVLCQRIEDWYAARIYPRKSNYYHSM
jgi:hypothetical protein